jgi:hypothetical protein
LRTSFTLVHSVVVLFTVNLEEGQTKKEEFEYAIGVIRTNKLKNDRQKKSLNMPLA